MKTGKIPGVRRPVPRLILACADAPARAEALEAGVGAVLLPAGLPLPDGVLSVDECVEALSMLFDLRPS